MLDPLPRLPRIRRLLDQKKFFVIHAPRQTGKTTTLKALASRLTLEGDLVALVLSCETSDLSRADVGDTERRTLDQIRLAARNAGFPAELMPPDPWPAAGEGMQLQVGLSDWAHVCPKPLALFFDEIDALQGDNLRTVLRQLRAGYNSRPDPFPEAIALCGMRDVRDMKAASGGDPSRLGTSSPFNIKEGMRLGDFGFDQVVELYGQHTQETGQEFAPQAIQRAFEASQGQPWLVNALAYEIVDVMGITGPITDEHMDAAVERLIRARATHLDSLVARLHEPSVQRVIEPMLTGRDVPTENMAVYNNDVSYVRDLGLVTRTPPMQISNPIYQEVITRALAASIEDRLELDPRTFVGPDGRLDSERLITEFAAFWRKDGDLLSSYQGYTEAAAQLVFMGFLHRVVNGGGIVDREYALGRGRTDICIRWPRRDGAGKRTWQWEAIELKVHRNEAGDPVADGLQQLDRYLDHLDQTAGTLIVFGGRPEAPPARERTRIDKVTTPGGRAVRLLLA